MKIKLEQLQRSLQSGNPAVVWLAGDEPLLVQEGADLARHHFRQQGFQEREVFTVDRGFDWEQFLQASGNLSLFADKKLMELRLAPGKLEDAGKKALQQYLQTPDDNLALLITGPKLEKASLNAKWFKAIESHTLLVQVWPVNRDGLGTWLEQRLLRENIRADAEALQLLVEKVEGNLLAAMQEIEKLKLLASAGGRNEDSIRLDAKTVMQVVADNSRYNAYQVIDAALMGDLARAQKILMSLRGEGVFPLVILGAITRELRLLLPILEKKSQGQGINAIMQSARVWFNRKQAVAGALQRLDVPAVWYMLEQARLIDQSIKGMNQANCWDELSRLLASMAGKPLIEPAALQ